MFFCEFRAVSHITGFVIRQQTRGGCRVGYIAHCDPQGTLPPWLVNKVTHSLGPRMVKDLRKAALGYKKWKNAQTHQRKPWRFPEEIITPRISVLDVSSSNIIFTLENCFKKYLTVNVLLLLLFRKFSYYYSQTAIKFSSLLTFFSFSLFSFPLSFTFSFSRSTCSPFSVKFPNRL